MGLQAEVSVQRVHWDHSRLLVVPARVKPASLESTTTGLGHLRAQHVHLIIRRRLALSNPRIVSAMQDLLLLAGTNVLHAVQEPTKRPLEWNNVLLARQANLWALMLLPLAGPVLNIPLR